MNPAELERGACNRPAGVGNSAHDPEFPIGLSVYAPDQRADSSRSCRAGPASAFLPLASQGANYTSPIVREDSGLRQIGLVIRLCSLTQPNFDDVIGLGAVPGRRHRRFFFSAYGALRLRGVLQHNLPPSKFFVSRPKPGSYPTDDGTKFLHAQQHRRNTWKNLSERPSEKFGARA